MRAIVTVLAALAATGSGHAQNYPERQVVMVVPFPAGGATDPVARALAQRIQDRGHQGRMMGDEVTE